MIKVDQKVCVLIFERKEFSSDQSVVPLFDDSLIKYIITVSYEKDKDGLSLIRGQSKGGTFDNSYLFIFPPK